MNIREKLLSMRYSDLQIVLQEVPGEISICFTITGCKIHCKGCHSPNLWKEDTGYLLSKKVFEDTLEKYKGYASCVLFMGGEWHKKDLLFFLTHAKENGFNTCLYTGEEAVEKKLLNQLTWIKTGQWIEGLGGLDNPNSNQKFKNVRTNKLLNNLFIKTS